MLGGFYFSFLLLKRKKCKKTRELNTRKSEKGKSLTTKREHRGHMGTGTGTGTKETQET